MAAVPLPERPPGDPFTRQTSETYRGHRLTVATSRGAGWGRLAVSINGNVVGHPYGTTNAHALRELTGLRGYVDDAFERPSNYHNGLGEYAFARKG